MSHPSKVKGTAAERALVGYLRSAGFPNAERLRAGWADDRGDVDLGLPGHPVVVEVKNHARLTLAAWLDETDDERRNAAADLGLLVVKRRGVSDPAGWYAVLPVAQAVQLLRDAGHGTPLSDAERYDLATTPAVQP